MKNPTCPTLAAWLLALAAALPAQAAGADDANLKLANSRGCMTCHHIEPGATGPDGLPEVVIAGAGLRPGGPRPAARQQRVRDQNGQRSDACQPSADDSPTGSERLRSSSDP